MADQPYTGPEVDAAVRILREDATAARDAKLMERLDKLESRLERVPVKEMTAEEKAAEYDRLIAAQKTGGAPPAGDPTPPAGAPAGGKPAPGAPPPAPAAKQPTPPPAETTRKSWWDGYQNAGG